MIRPARPNGDAPLILSDVPFGADPARRHANVLACEILAMCDDHECPEPAPLSAGMCMIWPHTVDRDGYGHITDVRSAERPRPRPLVHRLTAAFYIGWDIHEGYVVHHMCEVKRCANPRHLAILTPEEHGGLHAWERAGYPALDGDR